MGRGGSSNNSTHWISSGALVLALLKEEKMKHETVIMTMQVLIDKEIVPTVKWLNELDGVMTLYSCQGDKQKDAYVKFKCINPNSLKLIIKKLAGKSHDVEGNFFVTQLATGEFFQPKLEICFHDEDCYLIKFGSIDCLKFFQEDFHE